MALDVQVVFDVAEPAKVAEFWALALGYVVQPPPPGFDTWEDFARSVGMPEERWGDQSAVVDPDGRGPRVFFQRVPEGKTVKNRVHIDVHASKGAADAAERDRLVAEHVHRLEQAGARVLWKVDEPAGKCTVMADPEGNEFCVQ